MERVHHGSAALESAPWLEAQHLHFEYSPTFQLLLRDRERLHSLLNGSFCMVQDFQRFERSYSFIAEVLDQSGTFLHVECTNGFLLRCLMEWSDAALDPYGIESEHAEIAQARALFPHISAHFLEADPGALERLILAGLPLQYHYLYRDCSEQSWSERISFEQELGGLFHLITPNGRLILGFHGDDHFPIGSAAQREEKLYLLQKAAALESFGLPITKIVENPHGSSHVIVIIERRSV